MNRERENYGSFFESDRWRREKIFSFFFSLSEGHVNHVSPYLTFYFKLISAEKQVAHKKTKKIKNEKSTRTRTEELLLVLLFLILILRTVLF